jgi:hypothetical protein
MLIDDIDVYISRAAARITQWSQTINTASLEGDELDCLVEKNNKLIALLEQVQNPAITEQERALFLSKMVNLGDLLKIGTPAYIGYQTIFNPATPPTFHNILDGLNVGDYQHLTQAEKAALFSKADLSDITFTNLLGAVGDNAALAAALAGKEGLISAGTSGQFYAWDKTFKQILFSQLGSTPTTLAGYGISSGDTLFDNKYLQLSSTLTGLSVTGSTITASNTVLSAFGALQAQINAIISAGSGLTSVGLSGISGIITVSGSPLTANGAMSMALASQTQNTVFAAPSGGNGTPSFRALVSGDLPNSGVSASTVGSTTAIPVITVDAKGRITAITTAAVGGAGTGTVTSVALALPADTFSISGSPITTSGTFNATYIVKSANTFLSGPITGADATPTWRIINALDIPTLDISKINLLQANLDAKLSRNTLPNYVPIGNPSSQLASVPVGGDLLVTSTGLASTWTIQPQAVTYAKMQNTTAGQVLLGRFAATTGVVQEITIGSGLNLNTGTGVLTSTGVGLPGGLDKEIQYNDNGVLGGITKATYDNVLGKYSIATDILQILDGTDATKILAFDTSAFTTATTRTWTFPNVSDTFVGLAATQTLTNKTLGTGTAITLGSDATGDLYYRNSSGVLVRLGIGSNGQVLNVSAGLPVWGAVGSGTGTVTTVSVVTANGFAGTVANASTTPAITLTTSINGILKGNGTAISAASAGTDFVGVGAITTSGLTMSTATFLGRTTAGTGAIEEIATNRIPLFGSSITGTANNTTFLRGDGAWATPAGGGTPGGIDTEIQYNNAGAFGGVPDLVYTGGFIVVKNPKIGTGSGNGHLHIRHASGVPTGITNYTTVFTKASPKQLGIFFNTDAFESYFEFAATVDRTYTFPDATGTISLRDNSETLTNKTLGTGTTIALGSDATGDIYYRNSGGVVTRLGIGTAGQVLTVSGGGLPSWAAGGGGSSVFSDLTAATGTNTINNASFLQEWQWNSMTSGALSLTSTSTAAAGSSTFFNVGVSGANASAAITTFAAKISNTRTGSSPFNVALQLNATTSGGTATALEVLAGQVLFNGTGTNVNMGANTILFSAGSGISATTASLFSLKFNTLAGSGGSGNNFFQVSGTSQSSLPTPLMAVDGADTNIAMQFQPKGTGAFIIGGGTSATELRLLEPSGSGTNYTGFVSPALAANVMYTLPTADGSSGQVLQTNGSGTLSWVTGGGGATSLTTLTASTATASINNADSVITWNWSSNTTQNAFVLNSASLTTGGLLSATHVTSAYTGTGLVILSSTGVTSGTILSVSHTTSALTGNVASYTSTGVTSGTLLNLGISGSTATSAKNLNITNSATSNSTGRGIDVLISGATNSSTTYGAFISNTKTGTSATAYALNLNASGASNTTNYGVAITASGATTNYAIDVLAGIVRMAAGTATAPHMILTPSTASLTSTTSGAFSYQEVSSVRELVLYKGTALNRVITDLTNNVFVGTGTRRLDTNATGDILSTTNIIPYGKFVQYSTVTVNATAETSLLTGTKNGSLTFNASTDAENPELITGSMWDFEAYGTFVTGATTNTAQFRLRLGGISGAVIADSGSFTLLTIGLAATRTYGIRIRVKWGIRTEGASAVSQANGVIEFIDNTTLAVVYPVTFTTALSSGLDTTANRVLDATIQMPTNAQTINIQQVSNFPII